MQVEHLAIGDYLVDDRFVFERKTLVDLTASSTDAAFSGKRAGLWVIPAGQRLSWKVPQSISDNQRCGAR